MNSPIKRTSALAIVSLVSGILGWTLVPLIGSITAIVTGHMARAEIRREPDSVEGDGLAIGGLALGYAMVAISLLTVLMIILFFGGLLAFLASLGLAGHLH